MNIFKIKKLTKKTTCGPNDDDKLISYIEHTAMCKFIFTMGKFKKRMLDN